MSTKVLSNITIYNALLIPIKTIYDQQHKFIPNSYCLLTRSFVPSGVSVEDPLLKLDDSDMMASMEEQLWAIEAGVEPQSQGGLMGMKLELPPLRKGAGAPGKATKHAHNSANKA
jgi:hypothetical protein